MSMRMALWGVRPAPSDTARDSERGHRVYVDRHVCQRRPLRRAAPRQGRARRSGRARAPRAGNLKSCLITNCLFRLGGVAALLSNRPGDRHLAKYRLDHVARTHLGADDVAYKRAPRPSPCPAALQRPFREPPTHDATDARELTA